MESKLNSIKKSQKHILKKSSIDILQTEEKEKIDIFQDLPLKDENDLQAMETKLKNDSFYRNQMVSWIFLFQYYKILEKIKDSLRSNKLFIFEKNFSIKFYVLIHIYWM